jgi:hypothetical protein
MAGATLSAIAADGLAAAPARLPQHPLVSLAFIRVAVDRGEPQQVVVCGFGDVASLSFAYARRRAAGAWSRLRRTSAKGRRLQPHPAAGPTIGDIEAFSARLLIALYVDGFAGADVVPVEPVDVGGSRIVEDATKPRTIPNRSLSSA